MGEDDIPPIVGDTVTFPDGTIGVRSANGADVFMGETVGVAGVAVGRDAVPPAQAVANKIANVPMAGTRSDT